MEKFKISDIQELFVSDVERFHNLTQHHLNQLLSETNPSPETLAEAVRQCHSLKGLAATVQAWGLSCLGADLEKLLELAGTSLPGDRAKANDIFEFILEHMQDWYVMNQFSCMDMLPQAWDIYQGLRAIMDERWPGQLPVPQAGDDSNTRYVRLADLELPQVAAPSKAQTPDPRTQSPEPTPALDVQGVQPEPKPGAPLPVRVVPPTLRHKSADGSKLMVDGASVPSTTPAPLPVAIEGRDVKQPEPIAGGSSAFQVPSSKADAGSPETRNVELETKPAPLPVRVVPPALRQKQAPSQSQEAAPQITPAQPLASPTASVESGKVGRGESGPAPAPAAATGVPATPPILRVAPPALKRRTQHTQPPVVSATDAPAHLPTSTLASQESGKVGSGESGPAPDAAAIFAALPAEPEAAQNDETANRRTGESETPAPRPQPPDPDPEWLELVSQEVAGYLKDLTTNLSALATRTDGMTDATLWQQTRRLFHTIKGTAATFNLDAVSAPAKAAEKTCLAIIQSLETPDPKKAQRARKAFETCCQRAQAVAQALNLPFAVVPTEIAEPASATDAPAHLPTSSPASVASGKVGPGESGPAPDTVVPVPTLDPEMAGFFINDARDQIQLIERAVLAWERLPSAQTEPATEHLWAAQRGFHTIKGAANSIGLTPVAQSVHEAEEYLEQLTTAGAVGSKPLFTFLLGAVDQLRRYLADLAKNSAAEWRQDWSIALGLLRQTAAASPAAGKLAVAATAVVQAALAADGSAKSQTSDPSPALDDAGEETPYLRLEPARLYELMNLIGEVVLDRTRLAGRLDVLAGWQRALAERNTALAAAVRDFQSEFEFNLLQNAEAETQNPKSEIRGPKSETPESKSDLRNPKSEFSELEFDRYDQFNVLARSLVEISHDIEQLNAEVAGCLETIATENAQFAQSSQELQRRVSGLSLVPVKSLFPRLQRAFRDALTVEQKEADLVFAGGEALLDKVVVDKVYGPLLHLVRNAVAHGIEGATARAQARKPARGRVRLSATPLANQIVIELADDGAGINAAAVRERAVAKGWLPSDAPALTPEQVVHFIFQPGFSTASKVTSVSGRGVGLDVVRTEVENLNGSVELRYEPGQGSTWSLRLPLTLAISEAILARLGEVTYAFPLNFIEYGVVLDAESLVRSADGSETYVMQAAPVPEADGPEAAQAQALAASSDTSHFARDAVVGTSLPVVRLSRLLGVAGAATSNKGLIVGAGERRAVLVVDEVLTRQEIVLKELDAVLARHPLLNGASLDAQGRVIPILNVPGLLKLAADASSKTQDSRSETQDPSSSADSGQPGTRNAEHETKRTRALVVDDSLSVRKVQERFLRELGCDVVLAKDGLEALERLRHAALDQAASPGNQTGAAGAPFDVVFTDLEMPRMNGFELITEVRGNPAWAGMPLVVVSSRGADKYITKAMNLGASTFLSKPFTQEQLGEVLRHFAGLKS